MADVIYRQEAIDELVNRTQFFWEDLKTLYPMLEVLERLPSAQTEREIGRWREVYAETDYRNGWIEFTCECCEYQHGLESGEYGWHYGDEIPWKFCPVCGAEMKGENDG